MEIILRASAIFFFLFAVARGTGKRELSEITAFELILLVTMGDLIQQGVTQEDMSVTGAFLAVGTLTFWIVLIGYLSFRFRRLRPALEGLPVVVLRSGQPDLEVLRVERLTVDELAEAARNHGLADLATVDLAVLEPDGKFSFLAQITPAGDDDAERGKHRADPLVADVVIVGGGVAGLGLAAVLAPSGHAVTVIERDRVPPADSPEEAFATWQRRGAPQARHSHAFLARLRNLLRDRAPSVLSALLEAGATEVDLTAHPPPALSGMKSEPGDEDLVNLACRRTTFEWVLRRHVEGGGRASLRTATVTGLVAEAAPGTIPNSPPRVNGVRLADGEVVTADVVVDAAGRRSPLPEWLAAIGAGPVEEVEEDTGIVYSSRFYRVVPGRAGGPPPLDRLVLGDLGHLKYALFPGDNGTFSITFGLRADDRELRGLLHPGPFTVAAGALPLRAWLGPDRSEPITTVEVMAGLVNRLRHFSPGGRPAATGVFAVGDSSVCTNPLYGRGCALALVQAFALADVLAAHPEGGEAASLAFDRATKAEVEPWYRAAVAQDEADRADAAASAAGGDGGTGVAAMLREGLLPAARADPVVYRAFVRSFNLLDPPGTLMADPDVVARVMAAWQSREPGAGDPMGPSRDELLHILRTAEVP